MTTTRRRGRPGWLWPVLVAFALVPIGTAVGLFLASRAESQSVSPPRAATKVAATALEEERDVVTRSAAPMTASAESRGSTVEDVVPSDEPDEAAHDAVPVPVRDDVAEGPETRLAAGRDARSAAATASSERPPEPPPEPLATNAVAGMGEVIVRARPWALVTIGGKSMGMTPASFQLPAGRHTVVLTKGDTSHTARINVARGRSVLVEHDFGR